MMHQPVEILIFEARDLFKMYYAGWDEAAVGLPCAPEPFWLIPRQIAYRDGWKASMAARSPEKSSSSARDA